VAQKHRSEKMTAIAALAYVRVSGRGRPHSSRTTTNIDEVKIDLAMILVKVS